MFGPAALRHRSSLALSATVFSGVSSIGAFWKGFSALFADYLDFAVVAFHAAKMWLRMSFLVPLSQVPHQDVKLSAPLADQAFVGSRVFFAVMRRAQHLQVFWGIVAGIVVFVVDVQPAVLAAFGAALWRVTQNPLPQSLVFSLGDFTFLASHDERVANAC